MPQMMLSWLYTISSWSARRSNNLQVASSEPVPKAFPLGKNCKSKRKKKQAKVSYAFLNDHIIIIIVIKCKAERTSCLTQNLTSSTINIHGDLLWKEHMWYYVKTTGNNLFKNTKMWNYRPLEEGPYWLSTLIKKNLCCASLLYILPSCSVCVCLCKLTVTALMSDTWPVKDCLHMPSRMSHSLEVASQAPDTKVL